MTLLHPRHPREAVPPSRSRSTSSEKRRRRPAESSSSSERRHRRPDRDRRRDSTRHRKQKADQSKHELMKQHEVVHEMQRRFHSSIDKLDQMDRGHDGGVGLDNEKNAWVYLVVSTCIVLASLAISSSVDRSHSPVYSSLEPNASMYWTSLSLCIIQLLLSLYKSVSLLYTQYNRNNSKRNRRDPMATLLMTFFAHITQGTINSILLGRTTHFAMTGLSITNYNMFYGCWVSFGLSSFLFGSALSSVLYSNESLFKRKYKSISLYWQRRLQFGRLMSMLWTMHFQFQTCVLASSISIGTSPICGGLLGNTTSCRGVSTAMILSFLNTPICLMCITKFLSCLRTKDETVVRMYGLAAFVSLVFQATTTGLVTTTGGLACNPGNLFVATWANTVLSLVIILRCIEGYWSAISPPSPVSLELASDEEMEDVMAFPSGNHSLRIHKARTSVAPTRSSGTPSTDLSDDEEEIAMSRMKVQRGQGSNPKLLALPAPPPARPVPMHGQAPKPPPPRRGLVSQPSRSSLEPPGSTSPNHQRAPRHSFAQPPQPFQAATSRQFGSVAPEPPPFRAQPPRTTSQEPPLENSGSDPPISNPGSVEDAAYYHSSRDITLHSSENFLEEVVNGIAKKGLSNSLISSSDSSSSFGRRRRPPPKARVARDPSMVPTKLTNSIGNSINDTSAQEIAGSKKSRNKSKSTSAAGKTTRQQRDPSIKVPAQPNNNATQELPSTHSLQRKSKSPPVRAQTSKQRSDPLKKTSSGKTNTKSDVRSESLSTMKQSSKKGLKSSSAASSSRRGLGENGKASSNMMRSESNMSEDWVFNRYKQNTSFKSNQKSWHASTNDKEEPEFTPDLVRPRPKVAGNTAQGTKPSILKAPSARVLPKEKSIRLTNDSKEKSPRLSFDSKKYSPFNSRKEHQSAVVAALAKAGSLPLPFSAQKSQGSEISSHQSPVTSESDEDPVTESEGDDDSGVETVSTDSDYSSFVKLSSLHSFDVEEGEEEEDPKLFMKSYKEPQKSDQSDNFLDYVYRPRRSAQNLNSSISRQQLLSSYFEDPYSAPMETIRVTDESIVSDPTLDNSIRTAARKEGSKNAVIDSTVRAALDRASEVQKSRRLSNGKITVKGVEGQGNVQDLNDIVAAALAAASEPRGVRSSTTSHPRKKSLSSNFSADLMEQIFSKDVMPNVNQAKCSFYGNSHTDSESVANC